MKKKALFVIVYEDDHLVAVNKASGIAVGGDRFDDSKERLDTLLSAALARQVFTVHRIDKETSGLVIFAKTPESHRRLSRAFESRLIKKRYIAVVYGHPLWQETSCDVALVPDGDKQHRTIIDLYQGKKSLTRFRLRETAGNYSILEAFPETGRTHQIRVHASALGHPVVCDRLYCRSPKPVLLSSFKRGWRGNPEEELPLLSRLGLHAAEIVLPNDVALQAPLPRDMAALLSQMAHVTRRGEGGGMPPYSG
jgi:RluA family pseudouridine synthase